MTGWHPVVFDVGYLHTKSGDSVENMQWNLLVHPTATVDQFTYHVMAGMKLISNKTISPDFNSAVFALTDNRALIAER